jgi:hypothetical protein
LLRPGTLFHFQEGGTIPDIQPSLTLYRMGILFSLNALSGHPPKLQLVGMMPKELSYISLD